MLKLSGSKGRPRRASGFWPLHIMVLRPNCLPDWSGTPPTGPLPTSGAAAPSCATSSPPRDSPAISHKALGGVRPSALGVSWTGESPRHSDLVTCERSQNTSTMRFLWGRLLRWLSVTRQRLGRQNDGTSLV